jgi:hypothetical protein
MVQKSSKVQPPGRFLLARIFYHYRFWFLVLYPGTSFGLPQDKLNENHIRGNSLFPPVQEDSVEAPVERVPGGHDRRGADPLPAPALTDIRPAQGRLDGPRLAGELTKDHIRSDMIQSHKSRSLSEISQCRLDE